MLLTDGSPNTTEDLRVYESAILEVAHTEAIDLEAKLGLATEEVSEDVLDVLLDHSSASDPQGLTRRTLDVSDVVVSRQLKRWHAVHTLETVYRDAFNNQLNDRYQAKFEEYQELSRNARAHALRFGIGLVLHPIPKAGAPLVSLVAADAPAAVYYLQTSWTSGTQEGAPSAVTTSEATEGTVPAVSGQNAPAGATGFNVYVGIAADALMLQTQIPIAVGGTFTLANTGVAAGRAPGDGQPADVFVVGGPTLRRG